MYCLLQMNEKKTFTSKISIIYCNNTYLMSTLLPNAIVSNFLNVAMSRSGPVKLFSSGTKRLLAHDKKITYLLYRFFHLNIFLT